MLSNIIYDINDEEVVLGNPTSQDWTPCSNQLASVTFIRRILLLCSKSNEAKMLCVGDYRNVMI